MTPGAKSCGRYPRPGRCPRGDDGARRSLLGSRQLHHRTEHLRRMVASASRVRADGFARHQQARTALRLDAADHGSATTAIAAACLLHAGIRARRGSVVPSARLRDRSKLLSRRLSRPRHLHRPRATTPISCSAERHRGDRQLVSTTRQDRWRSPCLSASYSPSASNQPIPLRGFFRTILIVPWLVSCAGERTALAVDPYPHARPLAPDQLPQHHLPDRLEAAGAQDLRHQEDRGHDRQGAGRRARHHQREGGAGRDRHARRSRSRARS